MTNTPSPDEDRKQIEDLRSWPGMSEGDALSVSTVALIMENAADRIESLLSDRAKLELQVQELLTRYP